MTLAGAAFLAGSAFAGAAFLAGAGEELTIAALAFVASWATWAISFSDDFLVGSFFESSGEDLITAFAAFVLSSSFVDSTSGWAYFSASFLAWAILSAASFFNYFILLSAYFLAYFSSWIFFAFTIILFLAAWSLALS